MKWAQAETLGDYLRLGPISGHRPSNPGRPASAPRTHLARQVVTEACQGVGRDLATNEGPQHVCVIHD
jgi:hypothetical protein